MSSLPESARPAREDTCDIKENTPFSLGSTPFLPSMNTFLRPAAPGDAFLHCTAPGNVLA